MLFIKSCVGVGSVPPCECCSTGLYININIVQFVYTEHKNVQFCVYQFYLQKYEMKITIESFEVFLYDSRLRHKLGQYSIIVIDEPQTLCSCFLLAFMQLQEIVLLYLVLPLTIMLLRILLVI